MLYDVTCVRSGYGVRCICRGYVLWFHILQNDYCMYTVPICAHFIGYLVGKFFQILHLKKCSCRSTRSFLRDPRKGGPTNYRIRYARWNGFFDVLISAQKPRQSMSTASRLLSAVDASFLDMRGQLRCLNRGFHRHHNRTLFDPR